MFGNDPRAHRLTTMADKVGRHFRFIHILADEQATSLRTTMVCHGGLSQHQGLLCNHLLIVPELNPVQARLLEQAVTNAEGDAHDLQRVTAKWDGTGACAKHYLVGIRVADLNTSLGGTAAFDELQENANLLIQQ